MQVARVLEEDKLHGTQTRPVNSSARSGAWKKIKSHGTQTQTLLSLLSPVQKKIKLQGLKPFSPIACRGLEEDEITQFSNRDVDAEREIRGLERNEITWFSNTIIGCLLWEMGFGKIKLNGSQTGWRSCTVDRMFWKRKKLQGSQTAHGTGRCYNKPCEQKPTPGL